MPTSLDEEIRSVLLEEAEALKAPGDLWDAIEARLDREPLRAAPLFRFPVERPWRAAVAVSSIAAAVWFLTVPNFLHNDSQSSLSTTASVAPVVMPMEEDLTPGHADEAPQVVEEHRHSLALQ